MPIADLDTIDPRDFDGLSISIGHGAGAQLPAGTGRSPAELIAKYRDKIQELIDGVNGLPFTTTTLAAASELTIASGAITVEKNQHTVDTEADAASDNLDTINGGSAGMLLVLSPAVGTRTVVLRHLADNIVNPSGQNISLAETSDFALLVYKAGFWIVLTYCTLAASGGGLGAALASTSNNEGASMVGIEDALGLITAATVEGALAELAAKIGTNTIADPGSGQAIPVTKSGTCSFTIAAPGETNTLAIPTVTGQRLTLSVASLGGGGDRAVTSAQAINSGGNTIMTFGAAADLIVLEAVKTQGALRWRVILNEGVALS